MMSDGKENIRHVTCTNHAARSDKDFPRVCPSKQSRRELEDLYFSLIENNTQLKKTNNGQREQIKLLTTKVHRMTVQKNAIGIQNKECCASAKAILNEQKESIENLKKANERLSDRIRILNMRLCSAKQFLKRSPASAARCVKCCLTPNASIKNSSMCALNTKESDGNLNTEASSSHFINKENTTNTAPELDSTEIKDEPCQQNKCLTTIEELKQKIVNLEEELIKTHEKYSERINKLEDEMQELRGENYKIKSLKADTEHRLETEEKKFVELLQKLRNTEAQCANLVSELQIERSKVLELETHVKSADISSQIAEALEKHLITATNGSSSFMRSKTELPTLDVCASANNQSPSMEVSHNSIVSRFNQEAEKTSIIKDSDDSGYADKLEDKQEFPNADQNILGQIASLQTQLNNLKLSMNDGDNIENPTMETKALPDNLIINPKINPFKDLSRFSRSGLKNSLEQIEKKDLSQSKIPLPVNAPTISNQEQNKQSNISNTSEHNKKISTDDKPLQDKNDGDITIKNYNIDLSNQNKSEKVKKKDEKKRKRSGSKDSYQDIVKNLTASFDQNETLLSSAVSNIVSNKETQENHMSQIENASCQDDSAELKVNETNLKKKIANKKENSDSTDVNHESHFPIKSSEEDGYLNRDENKKLQETNELPNIKKKSNKKNDEHKIIKESGSTTSGNSTYTVDGKITKDNSNGDATYHVENKSNRAPLLLQVGENLNYLDAKEVGVMLNQYRMPQLANTSTPKRQKRYKAKASAEVTRSPSPDNTDHEISSMTDLPNEDKSFRDYISPGEEKATSTFTESYAASTTTDYGSLSLGEVPMAGVKKLSDFETRDKHTDSIAISTTSNKMEEALQAISEELTRCRVLLQGQLPAQVIPDLIAGYKSVRN